MPAKLKISKGFLEEEGDELIKFIANSFQTIAERTLLEDELNNRICYLIYDSRIKNDVKEISIVVSSGKTPDYIPLNNRLGFYKSKYYAWFDDGKIPYPEEEETLTIKQLEYKLDLQLDEYIKHKNKGDDFLAELFTIFIKEISDRIEKLSKT